MTAIFAPLLGQAVDPDEGRGVGIRVEIMDLGSCFTGCIPELPPTGIDVILIVATAFIGAALVASGILFAVTRRRFSGRATDAR